jgi:hypothetical protein
MKIWQPPRCAAMPHSGRLAKREIQNTLFPKCFYRKVMEAWAFRNSIPSKLGVNGAHARAQGGL